MNVRFIDTSIVMNLLEIPYMCDKKEQVKEEFKQALEDKETLILPVTTIIESGNHIAHISDGSIRREKAIKFKEFLKKTANQEAPWELYGVNIQKEDLLNIANQFPESAALMEMGTGDLCTIQFYENYKNSMPALGRIMIWSTDTHLQQYCEDMTMKRRRNR